MLYYIILYYITHDVLGCSLLFLSNGIIVSVKQLLGHLYQPKTTKEHAQNTAKTVLLATSRGICQVQTKDFSLIKANSVENQRYYTSLGSLMTV